MDIELDELTRALGRRVTSYDVEAIDPHLRIHSVTGGVFRVRADGDSIVVKIVRHGVDTDPDGLWVAGEERSHRNYWKREWLAFDSGLLGALPGRLRAPRRLLMTQPRDDECWIWMEDVAGRPGAQWSLDDYAIAARDLGTTQGAYSAGRAALPTDEWLARGWLRGWVAVCERFVDVLADDRLWRDRRLDALRPLRGRVAALWESREKLLAIVDSAPQTLVHCDFWPANLIIDIDGQTVAIDWSQIGIGALAQDIDQIVLDPIWMQTRPGGSPDELERVVLPAYADGLRVSGFPVDDDAVARWYAAAAGIHYSLLCGGQALTINEPDRIAAHERRWGRPYEEILTDRAAVIERAIVLAEQALESAA